MGVERFGDELDERVVVDGVAEQEEQLASERGGGAAAKIFGARAVSDRDGAIEVILGECGEGVDELASPRERDLTVLLNARVALAAVVVDDLGVESPDEQLNVFEVVTIMRTNGGRLQRDRRGAVDAIVEGRDEVVTLFKGDDEISNYSGGGGHGYALCAGMNGSARDV